MSVQFTVAQLEAQKQNAQEALRNRQITQAGYDQWLMAQNRLIAEARAREAVKTAPVNTGNYSVAQLEAQKQDVKRHYDSGEITSQGYYDWLMGQDRLIAQAKFKESASSGGSSVSNPAPGTSVSFGSARSPIGMVNRPAGDTSQLEDGSVPRTGILGGIQDFFFGPPGTKNTLRDPDAVKLNTLVYPARGGTAPISSSVVVADSGKVVPVSIVAQTRGLGVSVAEVGEPLETKYLARQGLAALAAPAFVLFPGSALIGAGLGLGGAQGVKSASQAYRGEELSWITSEEAFYAVASGAVFGGFNAGVSGALAEAGASGLVTAGGRVATNTVLGGLLGGVTETAITGKTSPGTIGKSALIAGGISLGIEGLLAARPYLPSTKAGFKFTPATKPVETTNTVFDVNSVTGKVTSVTPKGAVNKVVGYDVEAGLWKVPASKRLFGGMNDALPTPVKGFTRTTFIAGDQPPSAVSALFGKGSPIPEGALIPYSVGTVKGFQPGSLLQTGATVRAMERLGYGAAELSLVSDLRGLAAPVQGVEVNPATVALPSETATLNPAGMTRFKELVAVNSKNVKLFGSNVLQPQLVSDVSYTVPDAYKGGKVEVSNRLPMDIDVQFSGSPVEADKFVADILRIGEETGNPLSVDPAKPYQVIGVNRETGNPAHAFDIKVVGVEGGSEVSSEALLWGFEQSKPATKLEGLPVQRLDEQVNRLGFDSILNFNADKTLSPVPHRAAKDTLRMLHALETAYGTKGVDITGDPRFTRTMDYFGITRETLRNTREVEYSLDAPDVVFFGSQGGKQKLSNAMRKRLDAVNKLANDFDLPAMGSASRRVGVKPSRGNVGFGYEGYGSRVGSGSLRGFDFSVASVFSQFMFSRYNVSPSLVNLRSPISLRGSSGSRGSSVPSRGGSGGRSGSSPLDSVFSEFSSFDSPFSSDNRSSAPSSSGGRGGSSGGSSGSKSSYPSGSSISSSYDMLVVPSGASLSGLLDIPVPSKGKQKKRPLKRRGRLSVWDFDISDVGDVWEALG